jgi:small subunit ribosomal protein S2e
MKILMMAGIDDCYTSARGCTATLGNFAKATFDAISKTYSYLSPTSGKRLCSSSLLIRNSLIILSKPTLESLFKNIRDFIQEK